jgi:glycosyltransferase involved in cell wall biosynthesis
VRVIVNQLVAAGRQTGVGQYTSQLLRQLHATDGVAVEEFPSAWMMGAGAMARRVRSLFAAGKRTVPPTISAARGPGSWRQHVAGWLRRAGDRLLERGFRAACVRSRPDVYHEPNYIPLPCDLPTVVTVHDLSALVHPEWHPADRASAFERRFRDGLRRTSHILTDTDFVRAEILRTLHVPPDRVTRTHMGIRPDLRPLPETEVAAALQRLGLPPRYLLYLGTLEPRKNVLTLLRAYCGLPATVRDRFPLVLVGGWGWNAADVADFLDREARQCGVLHAGYVADRHLPVLYNGARALVFPSLYEGFGLPPVEMLACGGAVLASTAGAVAETAGAAAHLIDALDQDGWRDAMRRIAKDDDWWQALRARAVAAARPFTWERCAAETLAVYRRVCASSTRLAS